GYDYEGDLWSPGVFRVDLEEKPSVTLIGSTEEWDIIDVLSPNDARNAERDRRERLLERALPAAQEGHTVHETSEEAMEETERMLRVYETFARDYLAIPVLCGEKTESERFPGAVRTYCIEAMVQDRKAIQAGTSHFLGQNFAKASDIKFLSRTNTQEIAWTTSWGVSTRLIGTLIMAHGDDDGLVLPPRIAPSQVVIIPITPKEDTRAAVLEACDKLAASISAQSYQGEPIRVEIDKRDIGGGVKSWDWIKRGVPVRVEIGPRDLEKNSAAVCRRDKGHKEKDFVSMDELPPKLPAILEEMQSNLLQRATEFRDSCSQRIDSKEEFYDYFTAKNSGKPEIHGGFALTHWNGSKEVEAKIKEDLKVTIRCIPFTDSPETGTCPFTGEPSRQRVIFAKSY
ncbi:MAG: His/Gly/Thr/Pro-type tRNA ligase C-terminal domain-containing protein, partial [Chthoniobacterales bacterium]